ncbi:hypothetical protein [Massilia sp. ST3]|uniref:hypothetical protein n=1 Tax=Massilia sp. ST3 TaxID=2824903 RepID=UPI001B83E65A|nr:hypothetical protein [Massilia sp. ST3]MBQ5949809.1 hypothetical protein [Massilia sp. ST3]
MDRRTDYKTALLIENVIHEAASNGRPTVARELAGMGVPLEVTLRVLTRPAERRNQLPTIDLPTTP